MKNNILKMMVITILILTIIMAAFTITATQAQYETSIRNDIVALNEIEQLAISDDKEGDSAKENTIHQAIGELQHKLSDLSEDSTKRNISYYLFIIYIVSILFIVSIYTYIYFRVIQPFHKLCSFALEVSKGNFDSPLYYERMNLFGEFTWAFDHMRKEVMKARKCEKEAIDNNKTVIATISHDIKTPIASIRAYTEALEAGMDNSLERRKRYLSVIMRKCDEVSKLTNDLFLHSLSDLDKLQMNLRLYHAGDILSEIITTICAENSNMKLQNDFPQVMIMVDKNRLEQVFENLVNNALKYAKGSEIELHFVPDIKCLRCHIRDFGEGIPEEDMPFIFDKFYRGRNCANQPGSGLGLYIVKYIMEQMDGSIILLNRHPGLEAILEIPLKN